MINRIASAVAALAVALFLMTISAPNARAAQDITAANPDAVKVVLENDQVRVVRISLAPHQKMPLHETRDGVNVPLKDYVIVHRDAAGNAKVFPRKAGVPEWIKAGERTVESGDDSVESLLVEIKAPASTAK